MTASSGIAPQAPAAALDARGVSLRFGAVAALTDVSFQVPAGQVFAVIGPNGAGKTSLFNLLSCIYAPTAGSLRCFGTDLAAVRPHQLAGLGVARTFQNLALVPGMSVLDNVLVARSHLMRSGFLSAGLSLTRSRGEERAHQAAALDSLAVAGISALADQPVGTLAYGVRKHVELARAIAMEPRLLLLDEPVAGMSQGERTVVVDLIRVIRERFNPTIVLVEHDMGIVMALAERILVLDFGRPIALGTPAEIQSNPDVVHAYLGEPDGLLAELGEEPAARRPKAAGA